MAQTGQLISYSHTADVKRTVTDRILMADPYDIVLITALGLDNEDKFNFVNTPGKMYEWLEDTYLPRQDTVDSGLASSSTTTTFSASHGEYFQPGDQILIDSEYMWVSAVSGDVVTVVRNKGGTQATHADNSTVYIVGRARLEGDAADDSGWTEPSTGYNYSQIFQKTIEISRTAGLLQRYGIDNLVEYEIDKAMDELMMLLCLAGYHGVRAAGSATVNRSFGGLEAMISSNGTDCSGAALTRKNIEDAVQDCWAQGGNPGVLFTGAWAKRKIASFFEGYVRTERSERVGGIEIDRIETPLGIDLAVIEDRLLVPANRAYLVDTSLAGFITIDPFFEEELGKSKDTAYYGQVVGEYGFVLAVEDRHAKITGFSTSA